MALTARSTAVMRLYRYVGRQTTARAEGDMVAAADARTSCDDARAALSLACDVPVEEVDPSNGTSPIRSTPVGH